LDQFFAPIADCLERFGLDHNLMLTRYWHQEPCWDFMFQHTIGGVGRIMIFQEGEELLSVHGLWWVDRYDEFARYIRRSPARTVRRDPDELAKALQAGFEEVLGWREGEWDEIARDYREQWSAATKEAFESANAYYPIPRV
jgi:hypothetical protein